MKKAGRLFLLVPLLAVSLFVAGCSGPFTIGPPTPPTPGQPNTFPPPGPTTPSATPDLSGQWKSSIGLVYDITQTGNQIAWTVTQTNEKGQGIVSGTTLSASWQGPQGSGSSEGQITGTDAAGRATQIDWKNGVRFYR